MPDSIGRAEFAMFANSVKDEIALVRSSVKDDVSLIRGDLKDLLKMNQEFLNRQILEDFKSEEQATLLLDLGTRQAIVEKDMLENEPVINYVKDKKKNYTRLMTAYFVSFFGAAGLGTWKYLTDTPPPTPIVTKEVKE